MEPKLETIIPDDASSLICFHYECESFQGDHGWHYHPQCEFAYILQGAGTFFIGDSVEPFYAGDLVFIGENIPHCWVSNDDEKHNQMLVLQFKPDCLGQGFVDIPEAKDFRALLTDAKRGVQIKGEANQSAKNALSKLADTQGMQRISWFTQLIDVVSRAKEKTLLTSELYLADYSEFNGGRLSKVMDYVSEHLTSDIKQTDVAEVVNMTPQSFSRFFRATTGRTFVSFVNVMRVAQACRLLVSTQEDITDIAFECGYANLSNFNRRFSEIKSMTPSEYRQKHALVG